MIVRLPLPFILVALLPNFISAQFSDDLSDGNFTSAPAWSGSDALFTVVDDGGDFMLRSNSPVANTYYLSTPSTLASDAFWQFEVDMRLNLSGSNYTDIYLISTEADLTATQNGWFVRVGGTQDRIELFKRVAGVNTSVIASMDGVMNSTTSNNALIRVERTADLTWTLKYDEEVSGTFVTAGTTIDAALTSSTHFGVLIVQNSTASMVNNHFYDDFIVDVLPVDDQPPLIISATVIDENTVDLLFDEPLDAVTATSIANFSADNSLGQPLTATMIGASTVRLDFASDFVNGTTYTITVSGVQDLAGNAGTGITATFMFFVPDIPEYRDVVINELMADPDPSVDLPNAEYLELFNATDDKFFDLSGWTLTSSASQTTLPSYTLAPGQYVLIASSTNLPLFTNVTNGIAASLPALNNTGTTLTLLDANNTTIDVVAYTDDWYGDTEKDDGGWSLEQIDPFDPCSGQTNWSASNDGTGGTPGTQNSIFDPTPDATAPALSNAYTTGDQEIELLFSEPMDIGTLENATYTIDPNLGISNVDVLDALRVRLELDQELVPGIFYTVTVSGVTDCAGNGIGDANAVSFAIPEPVSPGDIVINEIMFDPPTGSTEWIELYNRSNKVLDLRNMYIGKGPDDADDREMITNTPWILMPDNYVVLTSNIASVASALPQSRTERFLQMSLPSLPNDGGTISVLDSSFSVIDRFVYDPDMHFELVSDPKGYSLERIDPNRSTGDATNWQTAADNAGRATPGYLNSQYSATTGSSGTLTIEPAIFSPDNDGHQDVLTINYNFDQPGYAGTILIFDAAGREVKRLMDNQLLGTSGAISWDGILDSGSKARIGAYIVMLEAFDLEGDVQRFKKTITLAHFLE
jgi:hypothetical protein